MPKEEVLYFTTPIKGKYKQVLILAECDSYLSSFKGSGFFDELMNDLEMRTRHIHENIDRNIYYEDTIVPSKTRLSDGEMTWSIHVGGKKLNIRLLAVVKPYKGKRYTFILSAFQEKGDKKQCAKKYEDGFNVMERKYNILLEMLNK